MSKIDSAFITKFFRLAGERLEEERQYLCGLDGEIGDGDHGTSMAIGFAAVNEHFRKLPKESSASFLLKEAASVFLAEVGATVGPLYASAFLSGARAIDGKELHQAEIGVLLLAFAKGIKARGKAERGDKTMIDVWFPAAQAALATAAEGGSAQDIFEAVDTTAESACDATASMIASRGRAARLKERSLGHADPGAASASIILSILPEMTRE